MKLWTLEQLSQLPEARAVQKHFDRLNYRALRWAWLFSAFTAFGFLIANSVAGDFLRCGATFAWMGVLFAVYAFRAHPLFEEHFARIVTGFLLVTAGAMVAVTPDPEARAVFPAALMPMALLFFRLHARQVVTVAGGFVAIAIAAGLTSGGEGFEIGESVVLPLVVNSTFAGMSLFLARQARRAFLDEWIGLASRERERERMSDELADARKIQLAMLPGAAPNVGWLSIASASLPASEVGGDFYDHFVLPDGSIALTIGDVAGHGVGSGLVLAGIKSGLHLLRDELREPVRVLDRLNRLASEWLQWRMLVTQQVEAALDACQHQTAADAVPGDVAD
ncbi:MAG: PP2C family protein-serine/threonine phosphatase, partial [Thermoanaerobaculia bacterium]